MSNPFAPLTHSVEAASLRVANQFYRATWDAREGTLTLGEVVLRCAPATSIDGQPATPRVERVATTLATPTLVRVVEVGQLATDSAAPLRYRLTFDAYQTGNLHLHARITAEAPVRLSGLALPRLRFLRHAFERLAYEADGLRRAALTPARLADAAGRWYDLQGSTGSLGLVIKKLPWRARWNDVGAHDHAVLADAALAIEGEDGLALALRVDRPLTLEAGETVEAALFLRFHPGDEAEVRREGTHRHPDEVKYSPEGEYLHALVWETDEVWLGPPITQGCLRRPQDQLIPRVLGLDVLARKRFTWNNEDFSLWHLTGKDRYWESGVKKAHALLATQNEHGGWWEGIEFYNLPPHHHHMYDTYIAGVFLLDAWDNTADPAFLEAAGRCVRFWTESQPPANGHSTLGPEAWWYRWGGYINEYGFTDERLVLNTHAGACMFLALYHERTGDPLARRGLEYGFNAFKLGLQRGIQKGNGQFLYCLSQIDPTLERPGDPPYIQLDLVPQIEDVYTVAASYRLMLANRSMRDETVRAALARALDYWWKGYQAGTVYTYRAYAVNAFAIAAAELAPAYLAALPTLLKNPDHYTSMQRGFSAFIAPYGLHGLPLRLRAHGPSFVEPVFVARQRGEYRFALVNMEYPLQGLEVEVQPRAGRVLEVEELDLFSAAPRPVAHRATEHGAAITLDRLPEFGVRQFRVRLEE